MAKIELLDASELKLARWCLGRCMERGVGQARITLSKSEYNTVNALDGKVDRILSSMDASMTLQLFMDGRYGSFTTNLLQEESLDEFIREAVATTSMMAPDECRRLPDASLQAENCTEGDEMDLLDENYFSVRPEDRIARALAAAPFAGDDADASAPWKVISVESEYADGLFDEYLIDSNGFVGRQTESTARVDSTVTVMDKSGSRYEGYWWTAARGIGELDSATVFDRAVKDAASHVEPVPFGGGKYRVVIDRSCASKLVSALISALDGMQLQQEASFLRGSLGNKLFSEHFTMYDIPLQKGAPGSRLYDSEGVRAENRTVIENGVVRTYFLNTYAAGKLDMAVTAESVSRPCFEPFICNCAKKEINLKDILSACGNGLYVTGFNGGNINHATGNFSYGVEGIIIENGVLGRPVRAMLMTGNLVDLFCNIVAVGSDARREARWQVPTMAFDNVDINA